MCSVLVTDWLSHRFSMIFFIHHIVCRDDLFSHMMDVVVLAPINNFALYFSLSAFNRNSTNHFVLDSAGQ